MTDLYQPCGCATGGHEPGVCQIPEDIPYVRRFAWHDEVIAQHEAAREAESEATWWREVAAA